MKSEMELSATLSKGKTSPPCKRKGKGKGKGKGKEKRKGIMQEK